MGKSKDIKFTPPEWADRVRRLIKERGLTQETAAALIDRSQGAIGHWLAGRKPASLKDLDKLASILDVAPEYLIYGVKNTEQWPFSSPLSDFKALPDLIKKEIDEFIAFKVFKATEGGEPKKIA